MSQLPDDPKIELMKLVFDDALTYSKWKSDATQETKAAYIAAETALYAAIVTALSNARRSALDEAANECESLAKRSEFATERDRGCCADCAEAIRAIIDRTTLDPVSVSSPLSALRQLYKDMTTEDGFPAKPSIRALQRARQVIDSTETSRGPRQ